MAIAERTAKQTDRGYMVHALGYAIRLLPRPKICADTRLTARVNYMKPACRKRLLNLLRPNGKPLKSYAEWPTREDMEAMKEMGLRLTAKYMEWLQKEHGLSL